MKLSSKESSIARHSYPPEDTMIITAKFASTCPCCRSAIVAGSRVEWNKGSPARHVSCAPVAATPADRFATETGLDLLFGRRARGGCGNPRDCGDPTCHGECGFGVQS